MVPSFRSNIRFRDAEGEQSSERPSYTTAQGFQQDRQDDSPQHRFPKMYMKFLSSVQPQIEPDIYLEYSFRLKFVFILSLQSKIQIRLCRPLWNLLSWIFVIVSLIPTRQIINVVIICRRLHVIRLKLRLVKDIIYTVEI